MMAALLSLGFIAKAQVGINNDTPQATLDVTGKPTDTNALDGIIPPRLTGDQLRAKTYTSSQTGALVYVTEADPSPSGQTTNVTAAGYYYFNGTQWATTGGSSSPSTALYQNIRGTVANPTAASYNVLPTDYLIVTNSSSGGMTVNFPNLTAADAGRTVLIFNNNPSGSANNLLASPVILGQLGNNYLRGRTIVWTGTNWVSIGL